VILSEPLCLSKTASRTNNFEAQSISHAVSRWNTNSSSSNYLKLMMEPQIGAVADGTNKDGNGDDNRNNPSFTSSSGSEATSRIRLLRPLS